MIHRRSCGERRAEMKTRSILANIHTMEIKTENAVDVGKALNKYVLTHPSEKETAEKVGRCINTEISRINKNAKKMGKTFILNLNKWYGEHENIYLYSEFCEVLQIVTDALGITGRYKITRVDLKFDSQDPNYYEVHRKLFYLLLRDVQHKTNERNFWIGTDAKTMRTRSIRIMRNGAFEFEYYNKEIESGGEDPAAARFEIRAISGKNGITNIRDCIDAKIRLLKSSIDDEQDVIVDCLNMLYEEWQAGRYTFDKTAKEWQRDDYKHLYQFLDNERISDRIFSASMAIDLIQKISGGTKPQAAKRLENYNNSRGKLITYRQNMTIHLVERLEDAAQRYFDN